MSGAPALGAAHQELGAWTLDRPLGAGLHGQAWIARDPDGQKAVLKLVSPRRPDTHARLRRTLAALLDAQKTLAIPGAARLLDHRAPESPDLPTWYVTPWGMPWASWVPCQERYEISDVIPYLARTLARAHALGITHGHISPENLVSTQGLASLTDWALADRSKGDPDGRATDVRDFARTTWMLLMNSNAAPFGRHSPTGPDAIAPRHPKLAALDALLAECTDEDLAARPSMAEVAKRVDACFWWWGIEAGYTR